MAEEALSHADFNNVKIAILATSYNRKQITIAGLSALRDAAAGLDYHVYLVDDGSTDGTGEAVRERFPEATVIQGDGSLFWNGGMRKAWQTALEHPVDGQSADFFLLFNDDLELVPNAMHQLLIFHCEMAARHGPKVISIGKILALESEDITYGGFVHAPGLSRLRFLRASDNGAGCDTMNGNCVLIPASAVCDVGLLSEHYRHHTGDIDYGLRARKAGYKLFQTSQAVGRTAFNYAAHAKLAQLTWSNRKFILTHPKGLPVGEWLHFCRAHGGWLWPVNFITRYAKIIRWRS